MVRDKLTSPVDGVASLVGTLIVNKKEGVLQCFGGPLGMQKGYGEFADDIILLAWSREVACAALKAQICGVGKFPSLV